MKIALSKLVGITLAVAFLTSAVSISIQSSTSANQYNPWADYNGDGVIDISDGAQIGLGWMAQGDSTRNVNITNWPTCNETTVWFETYFSNYTSLTSPSYDAYGYGHLHILVQVRCLQQNPVKQNVTVWLYGKLWNATHTSYKIVPVLTYNLGVLSSVYNATTIPVPCQEFYFAAYATPVNNNLGRIALSFYPTWS